jgi:hypothetical protein
LPTGPAHAAEPLRTVVDAELKAAWDREGISPAPRSTDSEFLRRVYLDLVGTVPTYDETIAFLADADPTKREKLIDKLLDDPRFATAQADVWDLTMFGREPPNFGSVQKRDGFKAWLAKQFADNVPYNVWVRDLMLAEKPGPEMFLVQFRNQPEEATVAITKIFLGTQLQCARCHDHPYDVWTQKDFYGMAGFFVRLVVQESGSGNKRIFSIGEKRTGEVLFSGSVREQKPGRKGDPVKPKFLGGKELDEPEVAKNFKEPTPKAGAKLPKPDFSRKAKLAEWISAKDNPYLAKAAANRIWAQFMGRGIVHPVDDFHKENLPSHPKLLDAMTRGLVDKDFDLKWLIREIVNSDAYQLGLTGPNREAMPDWFERARVRPLSAEEIMAAMRVVTGYDLANKAGDKLPASGDAYFLRYFGEPTNGLGDFQGSLHEHLFLNNSGNVRQMISPKKGNLADTLVTSKDPPEKKVERLFLSVLHRKPSTKETAAFAKHLAAKDKAEALVEDCIWVLLNSSEFRFNH